MLELTSQDKVCPASVRSNAIERSLNDVFVTGNQLYEFRNDSLTRTPQSSSPCAFSKCQVHINARDVLVRLTIEGGNMQPGLASSVRGLRPGIGGVGSELVAKDNGHLVDKNCKT